MNRIELAHGGGGRMMADLIREEIVPRFGDGPLRGLPDAARLEWAGRGAIFSTDSFVVQPLFFPGGDIGRLAVHGTVNDIAVSGGRARVLSLSLILEEGLPLETLRRVLDSVRAAAEECGVVIATGDTKVVPKGQCDGLYLTTSGLGEPIAGLETLGPASVRAGDAVVASGTLGDHGMAVMALRAGWSGAHAPRSDAGSVHRLVESAARRGGGHIRIMRDPTRGGAAAVLNEWAENQPWGIELQESKLPFSPAAVGVAEAMGLDLLHSPSEGRLLMICDADFAGRLLEDWMKLPEGRHAAVIGRVVKRPHGVVVLRTIPGGQRHLGMPSGEQLPRIC